MKDFFVQKPLNEDKKFSYRKDIELGGFGGKAVVYLYRKYNGVQHICWGMFRKEAFDRSDACKHLIALRKLIMEKNEQ